MPEPSIGIQRIPKAVQVRLEAIIATRQGTLILCKVVPVGKLSTKIFAIYY